MSTEGVTIDSIYGRLMDRRLEEKEKRAHKSFAKGGYSSYEEALKSTALPSIMSIVKSITMDKFNSFQKPLEEKTYAVRYIIENIMSITLDQFLSVWNTESLKKFNMYPYIYNITNSAPMEVKKKCLFDRKFIFIYLAYPEEFDRIVSPATKGVDIFNCNDDIKNSLIQAGSSEEIEKGKIAACGQAVDDIILQSIYDTAFKTLHLENERQVFEYLSDCSDKTSDKVVGISDVVEKRGYTSVLDFYFLHKDQKFQIENLDAYLYYREKAHLPEDETIALFTKAYFYAKYYSKSDPERVSQLMGEIKAKNPALSKTALYDAAKKAELSERKRAACSEYDSLMEDIRDTLEEERLECSSKEAYEADEAEEAVTIE